MEFGMNKRCYRSKKLIPKVVNESLGTNSLLVRQNHMDT